jgi:hypothetical protein
MGVGAYTVNGLATHPQARGRDVGALGKASRRAGPQGAGSRRGRGRACRQARGGETQGCTQNGGPAGRRRRRSGRPARVCGRAERSARPLSAALRRALCGVRGAGGRVVGEGGARAPRALPWRAGRCGRCKGAPLAPRPAAAAAMQQTQMRGRSIIVGVQGLPRGRRGAVRAQRANGPAWVCLGRATRAGGGCGERGPAPAPGLGCSPGRRSRRGRACAHGWRGATHGGNGPGARGAGRARARARAQADTYRPADQQAARAPASARARRGIPRRAPARAARRASRRPPASSAAKPFSGGAALGRLGLQVVVQLLQHLRVGEVGDHRVGHGRHQGVTLPVEGGAGDGGGQREEGGVELLVQRLDLGAACWGWDGAGRGGWGGLGGRQEPWRARPPGGASRTPLDGRCPEVLASLISILPSTPSPHPPTTIRSCALMYWLWPTVMKGSASSRALDTVVGGGGGAPSVREG